MKLPLQWVLYSTILCTAASLQCYDYYGSPDLANEKQVPKVCESNQMYCNSSIVTYDGLLSGYSYLAKGCTQDLDNYCNKTLTITLQHIRYNQSMVCCNTDLCNQHLTPVLEDGSDPWVRECLACNGPPSACGHGSLPNLRCASSKTNCIQVSITTALSEDTHQSMIKSCSNTTVCPGLAAFSNGQKPVSYASNHQCCNVSHCNNGQFTVTDPGAENGLQCNSRSSPNTISTMKCRGAMTYCIDLIGETSEDIVMSGCATKSFCEGLYPAFQIPGWKRTACCTDSLCNHANSSTPQKSTPTYG
ncbi:urokinase plasminogen activator surface receptor-like [Bombina bombina]|uniref:urokinase plasminogen activator surface receptor-like n=1 Tax=Bombina bombina TaxID=8345 RepID=UPI00235A979F|nr:urokinase plasminogen activator surface receptor-like [Bombina bombina]